MQLLPIEALAILRPATAKGLSAGEFAARSCVPRLAPCIHYVAAGHNWRSLLNLEYASVTFGYNAESRYPDAQHHRSPQHLLRSEHLFCSEHPGPKSKSL